MILGCEGRLIYTGGILGPRKLGPIGNRRGRLRVQEQDVEGVGIKMRSGWNHPKENKQHSEQGESLKSRIYLIVYSSLYVNFNTVFQKAVPTQDVTNQFCLPCLYCMQVITLLLGFVQYFMSRKIIPSFFSTTFQIFSDISD